MVFALQPTDFVDFWEILVCFMHPISLDIENLQKNSEKNDKIIKKYLFICQKKSYNKGKESKDGGIVRCACANRHSLQN